MTQHKKPGKTGKQERRKRALARLENQKVEEGSWLHSSKAWVFEYEKSILIKRLYG